LADTLGHSDVEIQDSGTGVAHESIGVCISTCRTSTVDHWCTTSLLNNCYSCT